MAVTEVLDIAWRYYDLLRTTGELLAFLAFIVGVLGYVKSSTRPAAKLKYRNMMLGGGAALVAILLLNSIYTAISWTFAGATSNPNVLAVFMPYGIRDWSWVDPGGNTIYPIVATVAPLCGILGLSAIVIGMGMWAIGPRGTPTRGYGQSAVYFGIGSLIVSVGGRLFSVIVYVGAPGFS
jgi:hypothetical protein